MFRFITQKMLDDMPEIYRLLDEEGLPCVSNRGEGGNSQVHVDYIYEFHADGRVELRAQVKQKGDHV